MHSTVTEVILADKDVHTKSCVSISRMGTNKHRRYGHFKNFNNCNMCSYKNVKVFCKKVIFHEKMHPLSFYYEEIIILCVLCQYGYWTPIDKEVIAIWKTLTTASGVHAGQPDGRLRHSIDSLCVACESKMKTKHHSNIW